MADLGKLHHYLRIEVKHTSHSVFLSQESYADDILFRAKMDNCTSSNTPCGTDSKLSADSGELLLDDTLYHNLAGALDYLIFARPDIAYAVQQIHLFMLAPQRHILIT
jgi:hypothetical protein